MSFIQPLGQLRASVSTYAQLPIINNVIGDLRIISDLGTLYTWTKVASSGSTSDWKKVTVSSFQDLQNRPAAAPLAIDNAISAIRSIYLNYIYIFFITTVSVAYTVLHMVDGILDYFITDDGIDLTKSSDEYKLIVPSVLGTLQYFKNDFDGSLDNYIKLLIHGRNFNAQMVQIPEGQGGGKGGQQTPIASFFDDLYNNILPMNSSSDEVITKFGEKSILFEGTSDSYLTVFYLIKDGDFFKVNGLDFTLDFWVRPNTNNAETIIVDHSFNHVDGSNFKVEKLANKTIKVSVRGATTYTFDMQQIPDSPVSYDVTSSATVEMNVWNHVAIERASGYLKLYINGVLSGTSAVADTQNIINYLNDMSIPYGGSEQSLRIGYGFNGRMEEIRYAKGIAYYSSNFTPRTVEYNSPMDVPPSDNMVLQSNGYESDLVPTSARIVVFQQEAGFDSEDESGNEIIPNDDIKVFISRDGGTTFTQATDLKIEIDIFQEIVWNSIYEDVNFLVGTVDLSSQPVGQEMVWKITTHNNKDILIRSVALNWK